MKGLASLSLLFFAVMPIFASQSASPITIQPQSTPVGQLYIAMLDRDIAEALKRFNPNTGLLENKAIHEVGSNASFKALLNVDESDSSSDTVVTTSLILKTADLAGAMGHAYSFPQSKYHQNAEMLQQVKNIFQTFIKRQTPMGGFIIPPNRQTGRVGTLEIAWCLEPLIYAYESVESDLEPKTRQNVKTMLQKGLDYLYERMERTISHQNMVWCAVMALGHHFTGEQKYLKAADEIMDWLLPVIKEDGSIELLEGHSIDHASTFIKYLFLYRLMTNDTALDAKLIPCLQLFTRQVSVRGVPLLNVSGREWPQDALEIADLLGALGFYQDQQSSFAQIATRYLESMMDRPSGFALKHGGGFFLRGAQYHRRPEQLKPLPYEPYTTMVSNKYHQYLLVGRHYQTAVNLRGATPFNGLQTWTYKGQPPLIFPSRNLQTQIKGLGFISNQMDILSGHNIRNYKLTQIQPYFAILITTQNELITAYVFSMDSTIVLYYHPGDKAIIDLALHSPATATAGEMNAAHLTYENSEAKILLPQIAPISDIFKDDIRIRIQFNGNYGWFSCVGPKKATIVQPVGSGLVLVHLKKLGEAHNLLVNLSKEPFIQSITFPDTDIPIPNVEALSAALVMQNKGNELN